jgi:capsular polysaccharide biosynthesis protein
VALEELLRASSFQFVFAEALSLEQKIHVFNEADLIVGEAGAGLANLYFCREGTRVLEIRPQAMKVTQEHVAMVDICDLDYTMEVNNSTIIISRAVHGADSYSVDLDLVSTWLGQINEGRNS